MCKRGLIVAAVVAAAMALPVHAERSVTAFVAITGAPTAANVERKLDALAAAGVDSFMFYPTSGMRMEYLGDEFFRCARDFAAGAAKRGMRMWLYDEYNWPSGSCRGRVPSENPRWRYSEVSFHRNATGGVDRAVSYGPQGWVTLLEPDGVRRFLRTSHLRQLPVRGAAPERRSAARAARRILPRHRRDLVRHRAEEDTVLPLRARRPRHRP